MGFELSYNCIFSCDLRAHWSTVMLDPDICAAKRCRTSLHLKTSIFTPPHLHTHTPPAVLFLFLHSFSLFFPALLAFIDSLLLISPSFPACVAFTCYCGLFHLQSSVSAVMEKDDGEAASGLYSCSVSLAARTCIVYFLSLHLALTHSLALCLPRQEDTIRLTVV